MSKEKFYLRNNITRRWCLDNNGDPIQFSTQRAAKCYANKHLHRFTIISYNHKTRDVKWRGGTRISTERQLISG